MSEMEHNKGVLRPLKSLDGLKKYPKWYSNVQEALANGEVTTSDGKEVVTIAGKQYVVDYEIQRGELCNFANVSVVGDEIHFETYHYNGSAYWTEIVERNVT